MRPCSGLHQYLRLVSVFSVKKKLGISAMPWESSSQPTDAELRILKALWELGPSPVRVIHETISRAKDTNYSTTVKMLSVMLDKGLVKRDEAVRPHIWSTVKKQATTQKGMLRDLMDRVYDGTPGRMVVQALASKRATKEELDEIREMLDRLQGEEQV